LDTVWPILIDSESETLLMLSIVGYTRSSVDSHAARSSSATAYLSPILNRTNLEVIIQTRAIKLLRSITNPTKFTTVQLAQSAHGPTVLVRARKEIILSSGVVGTPHLLLLSGIGPSSQLASTGIKPVVDLEDVGMLV
jgi:choline dehydrogenase-like flavoprotein